MRRLSFLALALATAMVGCGSKDSISLSASVSNVQLAVADKALGVELSGSFALYLEVGPEADGAATVELEQFSLVKAADDATLVPLPVIPQGATFPLTVGKGESKTVTLELDTTNLLDSAKKAELCAGEVKVVGAVKHDLGGGETRPLSSPPVTISGC